MADAREESSEVSSDSTSNDNFSVYMETSSSEEDLQNVEEPGTLLHGLLVVVVMTRSQQRRL